MISRLIKQIPFNLINVCFILFMQRIFYQAPSVTYFTRTFWEFRLNPFLYCLFQEPQWWQWQHLMQMTLPRITPCCATTSSDSHQTSRPQTCSTLMQKKATLSLSSHPRYLTERWVNLANVHLCMCFVDHSALSDGPLPKDFAWTGSCHKPYTCHRQFSDRFCTSSLSQLMLPSVVQSGVKKVCIYSMCVCVCWMPPIGFSVCLWAWASRRRTQNSVSPFPPSNRSETTGWLLFQEGDKCQNIDWVRWWKRNISCCQTLSA